MFPAVSSSFCAQEFGRYCAFSSFSFCNQDLILSSCQAVKLILALKNLAGTVPSCFQQFLCALEFGRYCAFSSFSFCIRESDLVLTFSVTNFFSWKN